MDKETLSLLVMGASKIVGEVIRYRPIKTGPSYPESSIKITAEAKPSSADRPTTAETVSMLEGRLNESLIALQPDLLDGARINGKSCDCLKKHTDEMLIHVRELQTMAAKPVYGKIRMWAENHNWTADDVARHPPEFFVALVPELRNLRKELDYHPVAPIPAVQEITTLAKRVSEGAMTREQAVERIKEMARAGYE